MKVLDNMEIRNCGQCKFGKNATINDVQYYQLTCSCDKQYPLYCFYPNSERPEGMMYGVYDHELLPKWCPLPDKEKEDESLSDKHYVDIWNKNIPDKEVKG
ncbi:MAG: hypothetical protein ABFD07_12730 [Methanobacterium sp.]